MTLTGMEVHVMQAAMSAAGVTMVDFQAGPLHAAAAQLDPKRGRAAQELLALDIVLEA